MEVLGIPIGCFDPALRAATDELMAVVAAAVELDAERIEPSHILLALGRIRGGAAASHLERRGVPVKALADLLRQLRGDGGGTLPTALTAETASDATGAVFADLATTMPSGATIGEAELLSHALRHLEAPVADALARFARIDVAAWAEELLTPVLPPPELFDENDDLDLGRLSPGACRVMLTLGREAGSLGRRQLGTALLLHTMAATSGGLLDQALLFLDLDRRSVRQRLHALVGGPAGPPSDPVRLRRSALDPAMALGLDRAALAAAARRSTTVSERDLLAGVLELRGGLADSFFRDVGVDVAALLRFSVDYYSEPEAAAPPPGLAGLSVDAVAEALRSRILGQDHVVDRLVPYVERLKLGLELGYREPDRPGATLMFCGPSGTGKTMAARALAEVVYGSVADVLMFEMGQFNDQISINNFIGAPPGYVGFGEGKLTNGLRDNPRRVLLFDEVDKATEPKVYDALLRLLDEGRISDPAGPVRDAGESVIVLTSNLGATELAAAAAATGEPPARAELRAILERWGFRPEFLNRLDEVIVFRSFDVGDLDAIAAAGLERRAAYASAVLDLDLSWDDDVPARVAARAATLRPEEAARGVNRVLGALVMPMLRLVHAARLEGRRPGPARVVVEGEDLGVVERPADGPWRTEGEGR